MQIYGVTGIAGAGKDSVADYLVKTHGLTKVALADPIKRACREIYGFSDEQLWGPSSMRNAPDKRYPRERHPHHAWVSPELLQEPGEATPYQCSRCETRANEEGSEGECVVYLTPRYALQIFGTEFGRHCYPDTWVDLLIRTANAILKEGLSYEGSKGLFYDASRDKATGVVVTDVRFDNELSALRNVGGKLWRIRGPEPVSREGWRGHVSEKEQEAMRDDAFDAVLINPKVSFEALYADVERIFGGQPCTGSST